MRPLTVTEKNWLVALLIALGAIAVFSVVGGFESVLGPYDPRGRLVRNVAETTARYVALSHFLIALLYTVTSKRMRLAANAIRFLLWLGLGVALGLGYSFLRGFSAPLAGFVFVAYFLMHDFRDQVMFYRVNGDLRADRGLDSVDQDLLIAPVVAAACVVGGLLSFVAVLVVSGSGKYAEFFAGWPRLTVLVLSLLPTLAVIPLLVWYWRRLGRHYRSDPRGFLPAHRPVLLIFAAGFVLVGIGYSLHARAYLVVCMHVTTWYVFILSQLNRRPAVAAVRRLTWNWMRGTPIGFRILHIGTLLVLVAGGVLWAYGFGNNPHVTALKVVLAPDVFPIWTIAHITASWGSH